MQSTIESVLSDTHPKEKTNVQSLINLILHGFGQWRGHTAPHKPTKGSTFICFPRLQGRNSNRFSSFIYFSLAIKRLPSFTCCSLTVPDPQTLLSDCRTTQTSSLRVEQVQACVGRCPYISLDCLSSLTFHVSDKKLQEIIVTTLLNQI